MSLNIMEKMSATFCILTVVGTLLVPTFAENETLNALAENVTTTNISAVMSKKPDDMTSSMNVSNGTEGNTATAQNAPINNSTTPMTTNEANTSMVSPELDATTKKMKVSTPGPKPIPSTKKDRTVTTSTKTPSGDGVKTDSPSVYIIVLIVIILVIAVIGIMCFCFKNNHRRFSVDIHAKNEDAQIPLAEVEPEMNESSLKGMKTFISFEGEQSSPTDTVDKTEGEKAPTEADQQVKESPAESQTTEPPAEKPTELAVVDLNDDPTASNKTSVETLNDVLNENNSNNNAVRDVRVCFTDICLND
ncbi:uncharacterized protein si:dkey-27h10.2 isoform X2 [Ictalurus punctatus]|uniref:Uncharacterized protein si:dkey-27h10.2 isoform X2 n=1 Tax=Ictalurus punctatus TaxID=7998 RepID=A0A9F7QZC4_ICTPU|nr:uncharacterized protein si:dkey-27h10.2 isoform X2 [Ictalurus punctatus]